MSTTTKCGHGKTLDEWCVVCESLDRAEERHRKEVTPLRARVGELRAAIDELAELAGGPHDLRTLIEAIAVLRAKAGR